MKNSIGILIFFLMTFEAVQAQFTDQLSQNSYSALNRYNGIMAASVAASSAAVAGFNRVMDDGFWELKTFSPSLGTVGVAIQNFIISPGFNPALRYNSYGYILKKYPVLLDGVFPVTPGNSIKNMVIRKRLLLRLRAEQKTIIDYLNPLNPIAEGERILLMLEALENVITITLENETF